VIVPKFKALTSFEIWLGLKFKLWNTLYASGIKTWRLRQGIRLSGRPELLASAKINVLVSGRLSGLRRTAGA